MPPPTGTRTVIGQVNAPRLRVRHRAAALTSWSYAGPRKPSNWISGTGRIPAIARPTLVPMMPDSDSGESTTRSQPNRCCSPSVTRKTPPFLPMSSPRSTTRSSRAISCARARLIASTRSSLGMGFVCGAGFPACTQLVSCRLESLHRDFLWRLQSDLPRVLADRIGPQRFPLLHQLRRQFLERVVEQVRHLRLFDLQRRMRHLADDRLGALVRAGFLVVAP